MALSVIDGHSHYMPPKVAENTTFFKAGWSDVSRQLSLMDQYSVEQALLLYPTSDAHLKMGSWSRLCDVYNQAISNVVKEHKNRFIGAGILSVDQPQEFPKELKRVQDLGLKVLSLASSYDGIYLDDERFFCVFEFAEKSNFPVHVDPQILNPIGEERVRDPLLSPVLEYVFDVSMCIGKMMMSGTFLKFPKTKFIFAHYGGVLPLVKERFDTTYTMLRKREFVKDLSKLPSEYFKNLYFDTSGSKSFASLLAALEVTDPSHIIFGSDFPANQDFQNSLAVIEKLPISSEGKGSILRNSVLKFQTAETAPHLL